MAEVVEIDDTNDTDDRVPYIAKSSAVMVL